MKSGEELERADTAVEHIAARRPACCGTPERSLQVRPLPAQVVEQASALAAMKIVTKVSSFLSYAAPPLSPSHPSPGRGLEEVSSTSDI